MAGNLFTIWARYKILIVFWLATLILIVASFAIQLWEADFSNRFVVTKQASVRGTQFSITYPSRVFLSSANGPVQEILLHIVTPDTTDYEFQLQNSGSLSFYDDSGKAIVPRWQGQGSAAFRVRVQAVSNQSVQAPFLRAQLSIDNFPYSIPLGQITIETLEQSRWRVGLGLFARNISLPLGLLSAIAGWVITYLGKETDKAETTFRENLSRLSSDFASDPLFAISQCIQIKDYAKKKHLDNENKKKLAKLASSLFQPETRKKIVQQLSELSDRRENRAVLSALDKILSFFDTFPHVLDNEENNALASSLQKIDRWLNKQVDATLTETVNSIGDLWDKFDVLSAGLVTYSLNQLPRQPDSETAKRVKNALEKSIHRKRLLRYPQLDWMKDAYGLTLPDEYHFITPVHPLFESDVVQPNISYSELFNAEKVVEESWVDPIKWENLASLRESACVIALEKDAKVITRRLWAWLIQQQINPRKGAFPVYWAINPKESFTLGQAAHRVAESWMEFIVVNPDAFLDLHSAEQDALIGFLGWHVGSLPALVARIKQRFVQTKEQIKPDVSENERTALLEKITNCRLPYNENSLPNSEQILDWLNIRPTWLSHTIFILTYEKKPPPEWRQAIDTYRRELLKNKVIVKEITVSEVTPKKTDLLIKWSDKALLDILKLRIQRTTGRDCFTALFAHSPFANSFEYDYQIVQKSKGSLGRMLELGQKILLHHHEYHRDIEELQPDDFEVIEQS